MISPVLQLRKTEVLPQGHTVGKPQWAGCEFRQSNWLYMDFSIKHRNIKLFPNSLLLPTDTSVQYAS